MVTLASTPENNAKIKALISLEKTIGKIYWSGNMVLDTLDKCLVGINLNSFNSGWYNPVAARINGLTGYYLVNQDGSLFYESRVIKQSDNKFLIEHLTSEGFNVFENNYYENMQS